MDLPLGRGQDCGKIPTSSVRHAVCPPVENPHHCDFLNLRRMLVQTHLQDCQERGHSSWSPISLQTQPQAPPLILVPFLYPLVSFPAGAPQRSRCPCCLWLFPEAKRLLFPSGNKRRTLRVQFSFGPSFICWALALHQQRFSPPSHLSPSEPHTEGAVDKKQRPVQFYYNSGWGSGWQKEEG